MACAHLRLGTTGDLETAAKILSNLTQRDPENAKYRQDLADSRRKLGWSLWHKGDTVSALNEYNSSKEEMRKLIAEFPVYIQWQEILVDICLELSSLAERNDSLSAEEDRSVEEALQIFHDLEIRGRLTLVHRNRIKLIDLNCRLRSRSRPKLLDELLKNIDGES